MCRHTLHDLARTWIGKITNRKDRTLHQVLPILVNPNRANRAGGIVEDVSSRTYLPAAAVMVYKRDVIKRKDISCNCLPSEVEYSSNNPYPRKEVYRGDKKW